MNGKRIYASRQLSWIRAVVAITLGALLYFVPASITNAAGVAETHTPARLHSGADDHALIEAKVRGSGIDLYSSPAASEKDRTHIDSITTIAVVCKKEVNGTMWYAGPFAYERVWVTADKVTVKLEPRDCPDEISLRAK
ncbi:hypothetical protein [Streptomyces yunnanensis]|uniref:Uncharacterized protein n=1 Tax=Streptomyces yunnanensis TaxID=156453 RepID=A0A9X8R0J1_9ACTN|nr:hypothetical protein [Streptomyces yunnanensis]SHN35255.1 hypothetical protein SAMN05216268_1554 [Streptomyces yunnanensis]